jgi:hypothetical protein
MPTTGTGGGVFYIFHENSNNIIPSKKFTQKSSSGNIQIHARGMLKQAGFIGF